jgi:hypothetical protein
MAGSGVACFAEPRNEPAQKLEALVARRRELRATVGQSTAASVEAHRAAEVAEHELRQARAQHHAMGGPA